jgi:hypothetical protein
MALEQEERTLKQAVKYLSSPEEDKRLADLIPMWRDAGRTIAEMLFEIMPKPEVGAPGDAAGMATGLGGGRGMWEDEPPLRREELLSEEEVATIREARLNEDGQPVDDEGNLLMGYDDDQDDLRGMVGRSGAERRSTPR